jgi:hypothetical protein
MPSAALRAHSGRIAQARATVETFVRQTFTLLSILEDLGGSTAHGMVSASLKRQFLDKFLADWLNKQSDGSTWQAVLRVLPARDRLRLIFFVRVPSALT